MPSVVGRDGCNRQVKVAGCIVSQMQIRCSDGYDTEQCNFCKNGKGEGLDSKGRGQAVENGSGLSTTSDEQMVLHQHLIGGLFFLASYIAQADSGKSTKSRDIIKAGHFWKKSKVERSTPALISEEGDGRDKGASLIVGRTVEINQPSPQAPALRQLVLIPWSGYFCSVPP